MKREQTSHTSTSIGVSGGGWLAQNISWLKSLIRIFLGMAWLADGMLKFQPLLLYVIPDMVRSARYGQPSWLQPWFIFWSNVTMSNPALFVYGTGTAEVILGLALVLGLMRKIAYLGGLLLSLLIWTVPEGFGGPYGPSSVNIGNGIIYAMAFLSLIMINTIAGPSKYSLDWLLEHRYPAWRKLAEFR